MVHSFACFILMMYNYTVFDRVMLLSIVGSIHIYIFCVNIMVACFYGVKYLVWSTELVFYIHWMSTELVFYIHWILDFKYILLLLNNWYCAKRLTWYKAFDTMESV